MIETFLTSVVLQYITGAAGVAAVGFLLKKTPNEKIKKIVGKFFYGLGVTVTLGLSKWKITKPFWNKIVEPWLIDIIDNIVGEAVKQFILGLRSDNEKKDK